MSVTIGFNGSVDFDTTLAFIPSDYGMVINRLADINSIWLHMRPYPQEPYQRLELFPDTARSSHLKRVIYYPAYPDTAGRVEVLIGGKPQVKAGTAL